MTSSGAHYTWVDFVSICINIINVVSSIIIRYSLRMTDAKTILGGTLFQVDLLRGVCSGPRLRCPDDGDGGEG